MAFKAAFGRQQQKKKKAPPRPPPPDWSKINRSRVQDQPCLIEWSPPMARAPPTRFGGSASSSFSSSTSSLGSENGTKPTIIRAKPNAPAPPSFLQKNPTTNFKSNQFLTASNLTTNVTSNYQDNLTTNFGNMYRLDMTNDLGIESSPPMPKCPPPSPPKSIAPHGVALFSFPATQPGDLALEAEDVVLLVRRVNAEWLVGRIKDREGIFPENFIRIVEPLPQDMVP